MSKPKRPNPNELLHAHVTRVGFDLSLGRTHIAALVYLDLSFAHNRTWHDEWNGTPYGGAFRNFIGGIRGLQERGLVLWRDTTNEERAKKEAAGVKYPYTYSFTRAGEIVVDLLKESGVYAEYAVVLPIRVARKAS